MRLIDADALYAKAKNIVGNAASFKAFALLNEITKAPTVKAKPVCHAKLERMDSIYKIHGGKCNLCVVRCSGCKAVICEIFHMPECIKCCPYCGAKIAGIDGGDSHDD